MKLFDANTWIGRWPFAFCAAHDGRSLADELRSHGIERALVSPLDAVLAPEPGPANRALLHETRAAEMLVPVPVINPALPGWREELEAGAADPRVRVVRVLPRYHNFRLTGRAMTELANEVARRKLRLLVQVRLIDERHEFHAMHLKPVPAKELTAFLTRFPAQPVLAAGLLRSEIHHLAPLHRNLRCDLSFAEWLPTVPELLKKARAEQIVFGSNTPILMAGAQRAKAATAPARWREAVARKNLERFLDA